jgi:hypothetical protein
VYAALRLRSVSPDLKSFNWVYSSRQPHNKGAVSLDKLFDASANFLWVGIVSRIFYD